MKPIEIKLSYLSRDEKLRCSCTHSNNPEFDCYSHDVSICHKGITRNKDTNIASCDICGLSWRIYDTNFNIEESIHRILKLNTDNVIINSTEFIDNMELLFFP